MINPLKVASGGYLKRTTKVALIIAISGYLNYSDAPTPTPTVVAYQGDAGWGNFKNNNVDIDRRNEIDDSEIIAIVKLTLKTTIL